MKNIGRVAIAAAVLLTLSAPCYTQRRARDVPGWESTRWGMSEAEILSVFGSRLRKLPKREKFLNLHVDYVIPEYELEGGTYTVFFQMDNKTEKLSQVLIRLYEQKVRTPRVEIFDSLAASLKQQYGEPDGKKDDSYSFGKFKGVEMSRTWKFPTTTIELGYDWDNQIFASLLTISYSPAK